MVVAMVQGSQAAKDAGEVPGGHLDARAVYQMLQAWLSIYAMPGRVEAGGSRRGNAASSEVSLLPSNIYRLPQ